MHPQVYNYQLYVAAQLESLDYVTSVACVASGHDTNLQKSA